jgi:hypothetical protein
VRKMKLPDYPANPIELRGREFHERLRKRPNQIYVRCHCSPL